MYRIGVVLTLFALLGLVTGCAQKRSASVQKGPYEISIDDIFIPAEPLEDTVRPPFYSAEERIAAMRPVADDGLAELWYCDRFMEIAVRDKSSGGIWLSTPFDLERDLRAASDTRNNIHSLLRIVFFDRQQNERRMSAYADVVRHRQFGHRDIENGIEIQMIAGLKPQLMLVPPAAWADNFEEKVLGKIPNDRDKRRLLSYYSRFSWNDEISQSTRESLEENFPGIVDHDLYILRNVYERETRMLEDIIVQTDYSWDDYQNDLAISGVSVELANPPMFKLTVSFTLDNGELVVGLPADKIDYDDTMYTLGRIHLLEFFGAARPDPDRSDGGGYLFAPDGSGAIINFNANATKPVAQTFLPVYGEDIAFSGNAARDNIRSAARLPVFGMREGGGSPKAWFAIIEEGEAMAEIITQSSQFFSGYETVSPALHYERERLVTLAGAGTGVGGSFRYIDHNRFRGNWTVRYIFLSGEDADYNGMARAYRRNLIGRGVLQPLTHSDPVLHLDVLGLLQKPDTFIGIPYSRRIKLTTFEEAGGILADMSRDNVTRAALRYRGWFNGGLDHTVPNRLKIERALGGKKGIESLTAAAAQWGYAVFLETDFTFVRRLAPLSGYSRLRDGSQTIDGFLVEAQHFEMMSNAGIDGWSYYTVSPHQQKKYFSRFAKNAAKKKINGLRFSISSAGANLLADYHRRRPVNLQQSRDMLVHSLSDFTATAGQVIVDGGNAYTLPFAGHIMNIPVSSSSHINTDESVPFMQLVLHGYVGYSGPAINMFFDPELALLKSVEYGADPAFMLARNDIAELKDTPYAVFYSIDYNAWYSTMVDMYRRYADVYRGLANVPMERHDRLAEGVYMTTFANGVQVLVNYNTGNGEVRRND